MKKITFFLVLICLVCSCKSKQTASSKKQTKTVRTIAQPKASKKTLDIIDYAKSFKGTRYKYGGTTKKGMDCSGLVQTSFKKFGIDLPRTTANQKLAGKWIDLKKVTVGDLVFFATKKNSRYVNHVGIVINTSAGRVEFIHASSSKGVMVSSLTERYWYFAFVQARRVL